MSGSTTIPVVTTTTTPVELTYGTQKNNEMWKWAGIFAAILIAIIGIIALVMFYNKEKFEVSNVTAVQSAPGWTISWDIKAPTGVIPAYTITATPSSGTTSAVVNTSTTTTTVFTNAQLVPSDTYTVIVSAADSTKPTVLSRTGTTSFVNNTFVPPTGNANVVIVQRPGNPTLRNPTLRNPTMFANPAPAPYYPPQPQPEPEPSPSPYYPPPESNPAYRNPAMFGNPIFGNPAYQNGGFGNFASPANYLTSPNLIQNAGNMLSDTLGNFANSSGSTLASNLSNVARNVISNPQGASRFLQGATSLLSNPATARAVTEPAFSGGSSFLQSIF